MSPLWEGRLGDSQRPSLRRLSDSLGFDVRLYEADIAVSRAHASMLADVGIIDPSQRDEINAALETTRRELEEGAFRFDPGDEDIHTAIERRVTELTNAGAHMHAGRSRNDQSAAGLRLWTKWQLTTTLGAIHGLQNALLDQARTMGDAAMPGYTHLQRAQPTTVAHHLLAHGWSLARDFKRLLAARVSADVSPLGAAALSGSTLPIDPSRTAEFLGFSDLFDNSLDAVADRDFAAESLFAIALAGLHLSRLGEELVLWATAEFGFIRLPDDLATGSSMMPQKANPDIPELARGKAGRLVGNLTALLVALKGLPLSYNKDLQEDKEPLFDSFDTLGAVVEAMTELVAGLQFDAERMADATSSPLLRATDLAEFLVGRGTPFREAHEVVGRLVSASIEKDLSLADLVEEELGADAAAVLDRMVPRSRGSGFGDSLAKELGSFAELLDEEASEF